MFLEVDAKFVIIAMNTWKHACLSDSVVGSLLGIVAGSAALHASILPLAFGNVHADVFARQCQLSCACHARARTPYVFGKLLYLAACAIYTRGCPRYCRFFSLLFNCVATMT